MTVEAEIANLTTSVDNLTSAVNVSKVTLDASVASAEQAALSANLSAEAAELKSTAALWFVSEDETTQTYMINPSAAVIVAENDATITFEVSA